MDPEQPAQDRRHPPESVDEPETSPAQQEWVEAAAAEKPVFPIVGVGASAGGLEAFTELLKHLPMDTGMGFVLVQHLAPTYHSLLTELLARATRLPVTEVTDGVVVEANHVYVIPRNTEMAILNGALRLIPRPMSGLPLPIDSFFTSLALDRGSKAVGVILSGSASDGTLGLKAIKANGGFTFAQDESAKYDGMPRSAITAGYVDFVLTPEAIARELARISHHLYIAPVRPVEAAGKSGTVAEDDLAKVFVWLRSATGVDFSHYKRATIVRRLKRRMVLHNLEAMDDYVRFLQGNRAELDALYGDMLISVTSFFREPEVFEVLAREIFPQLTINRPAEAPVRIWVPACSTGEEAYSIAICATEFLREIKGAIGLQLFATDVSETALEKARKGNYTQGDLSQVSAERLRQFFTPTERGYQVNKSIREMCVFAKQNVIKDPPFSRLDLISCRNLLIYLDSPAQKRLMSVFHYALRPGAFLVLGRSEGSGEFSELFDLVDKKHRVYSKQPRPADAPSPLEVTEYRIERPVITVPLPSVRELDFQKEINRMLLADYTPPGVVVDKDLDIVQFHGHLGPYLDPAPGAASLRLLKMAREGLALDLRAAIHQAQQENRTVLREYVGIDSEKETRKIDIEVRPLKLGASSAPYFLVLFRESRPETPPSKATSEEESGNGRLLELARQLDQTKFQLRQILEQSETRNEELQAANEEIASSNEELQSTNEELETAKEELQATNEELTTLNEELQNRNRALATSNNDLSNVVSNVTVPMLILGADLRIRWFTPGAAKVLNLIDADVGRPITDLRSALDLPDLEALVLAAVESMRVQEREVQDHRGHWHSLRVRPYKTSENRIEGAVLTLVDIDELKAQATEARFFAEAIVDTVRESILVIDAELKVKAANRAFFETFQVSREEAEGRFLPELGNGQWNIPELLRLLKDVLPRRADVRDFEVACEFPHLGARVMRLNARQVQRQDSALILLAIEDITERKRTAKATEEQARLIELAHDAIIVRDPQSAVVLWNRGAEELYGWMKEEAIGKITHPLFQTVFPEPFEDVERTLMTEGRWVGELVHTTRSGEQIVVASRQMLKRDEQGQPEAILEINRDITERRRAEESLRSSEARMRALVESLEDVVLEVDEQGTCQNVWTADPSLLIRPREELIAHRLDEFLPVESAQSLLEASRRVLAGGRPERMEYSLDVSQGKRWFLARLSAILGHGEGRRVSILVRDITAGREAEMALKRSEERFRLIVAGVRDYAIFALDAQGRIETWNSGAERIKGYRVEEILGRHFSIFFPAEDAQSGKPDRLLKIAAAEGRVEDEAWRVRKDGSRFWANVTITALRDEGGNLRGFTKITRDATDRKHSEEAIRQLSSRLLRAQDEERRRIARELHDSTAQTLSTLTLTLALVESLPAVAEDSRALEAVRQSEELAKQAAGEIRDLSHLLHPPELDAVGLFPAIRWYVLRFSQRSAISVELDLPHDLCRLPQDIEIALFRVVQEGLANVQRHSGSKVARVRVTRNDNEVAVEIEDHGRGMPSAVTGQGRQDIMRMGLGIASMTERVKQLGGLLEIASREGEGTTVRVVIPCPPE